jgi:Reverse transcriptase (RNA-dependent DNA polymerase)
LKGWYAHNINVKPVFLKRSLYGLKQAPYIWAQTLTKFFKEIGFKKLNVDTCIFIRRKIENISKIEFIAVYVDDLLIGAFNEESMQSIKNQLSERFRMTDLGKAHNFIGWQIVETKDYYLVHQEDYITSIVSRFGMQSSKPCDLPMITGALVDKFRDGDVECDERYYQSVIGSLLYISTCTRPDVSLSVGLLCRYMHRPAKRHLDYALRIVRYLKTTANYGIRIDIPKEKGDLIIAAFVDSDYGGPELNKVGILNTPCARSTSGYVITINGNIAIFKTKRQEITAKSSTEAEILASSSCISDVIFIRNLISELFYESDKRMSITLYCDNLNTVEMYENGCLGPRTRHIAIHLCSILEVISDCGIKVKHIKGIDNPSDFLTKPLPIQVFEKHRNFLKISFVVLPQVIQQMGSDCNK